ncbi:MAG: helix-turn-helix domain-containing protein [[Eubacterium] sulci]|nr:helix-turn-helix domain-containing protein [[Eubacterium] sulci]MBF1167838.1 helix-turn-helix domain-containing protein [[Eubacterium] sulci]MBF1172484.1 helix-turn-helix domain-containing protein [[Eubacterium] sulci]
MNIREIRALANLSQVNFGKKYNIPLRTIQDWEAGKRKPPIYVVELLEFKVRYDFIQN